MAAVRLLRRLVLGDGMTSPYIGESLSKASHMLRAGQRATDSNLPPDVVLACYFHDVGHLLAPDNTGGYGVSDHARIGACFLRGLDLPERTCRAVELHVQAKRYLVGEDPLYELSPASARTLEHQRGPMICEHERASFRMDPAFDDALAVRSMDDTGKCGDLTLEEATHHWNTDVSPLLCSRILSSRRYDRLVMRIGNPHAW